MEHGQTNLPITTEQDLPHCVQWKSLGCNRIDELLWLQYCAVYLPLRDFDRLKLKLKVKVKRHLIFWTRNRDSRVIIDIIIFIKMLVTFFTFIKTLVEILKFSGKYQMINNDPLSINLLKTRHNALTYCRDTTMFHEWRIDFVYIFIVTITN